MTNDEMKKFEVFWQESFQEGTVLRELRLSQEEKDYIEMTYLGAELKKIATQEYADQKNWYEVRLN